MRARRFFGNVTEIPRGPNFFANDCICSRISGLGGVTKAYHHAPSGSSRDSRTRSPRTLR